ncbi:hypothetical protein BpHYR1_007735 [Brachionus plicatilis]|uniref:Uncharacterized protein n=1 Tax=Brachionus plicatilis TaxID=10195 RepID=A0A3M7QPK0_BRAPC|nr:hypothetical protein BpHYR1_007735 [Brachionus plicatilis]
MVSMGTIPYKIPVKFQYAGQRFGNQGHLRSPKVIIDYIPSDLKDGLHSLSRDIRTQSRDT